MAVGLSIQGKISSPVGVGFGDGEIEDKARSHHTGTRKCVVQPLP